MPSSWQRSRGDSGNGAGTRADRSLILAGSLAVELFAWRPWIASLGAWVYGRGIGGGGGPAWLPEALALALGAYALQALRRRGFDLQRLRLTLLLLGLAAAGVLAATAPQAVALAFFSFLFLWWRGLMAAQYHVRHDVLTDHFPRLVLAQLAAVALASGLPAAATPALGTFDADLSVSVVGLFVAGLLTLAGSRLITVRQDEAFEESGQARPRWRPAVVTLVLVIAGVLLWAVRTLAGPAFPEMQAALFAFLARVLAVVDRVIEPLAYLIGLAIEPVVRFLAAHTHPLVIQPDPAAKGAAETLHAVGGHLPAALLYALRLLGFVIVAVALAFIFFRSVSSAFRLVEADVPEEREALVPSETESGRRLARPRRSGGAERESNLSFIRRAYRRLQRVAGSRGLVRAQSETPREFLGRLESSAMLASGATAGLTELYMQERYGPRRLTADEEAAAQRLLAELEGHDRAGKQGGQGSK